MSEHSAVKCECWRNKRGEVIYSDPCPVHSLTRRDSPRVLLQPGRDIPSGRRDS